MHTFIFAIVLWLIISFITAGFLSFLIQRSREAHWMRVASRRRFRRVSPWRV